MFINYKKFLVQHNILMIVFCLFFVGTVSAVVPQRYIKEVYPVDETIASLSKVINSGRLKSTALADVFRERGVHYFDLRHFDKAIDDFSQAISLNRNYVTAYINRGNAYAKLEKYEEAYKDFGIAQTQSDKNKSIYLVRGSLSFFLGRFKDAVADYRYYLGLKPDDMYRMLWLHLSQKYMDKNANSDLESYSKGLDLDVWPGALIKLYTGKVTAEEFLAAFSKNLTNLEPQYLCEGFYYIGQYFLLAGNRQLAKSSFEQAVKSNAKKNIEYDFAVAYLSRLSK
ncbi:MAG: tetratricopeptide repeat protein [Gammaproteobacteria bacterium]|nr:tetratricopeptide repeat protein [Gammaproteobacteria bacterium]